MRRMKRVYKVIIVILFAGATALIPLMYCGLLGSGAKVQGLVGILGTLAVAIAAVIAMAASNPKRPGVRMEVVTDQSHKEVYNKKDMTEKLQRELRRNITSHRIHFCITNTSGFTLKQPALTFVVPASRVHPHRNDETKPWSELTFHSNLYNSQTQLQTLQAGDKWFISNSNLPYWNNGIEIDFWIRMCIEPRETSPFEVQIALNCENGEGVTKGVYVHPRPQE